jgi:hypothetical protein
MPIKPEKGFHENRHEKRLSRGSLFLSSPVVRGPGMVEAVRVPSRGV